MHTPASRNILQGRPTRGAEGDGMEVLPEEIQVKIFCLIPGREIARSCALVCRSWRSLGSSETLWQALCSGSGLRDADAACFTSWRALFGAVYGTNLIASPYFERLDRIDADRLKSRIQRVCEPKHVLYPDRLYYDNELHEEPHSFCHWNPDGGSPFQRGGGDGIIREWPPVDCPLCPGAPEKPALATSYDWGKVHQTVDLSLFPRQFLNLSHPLAISVWYAGKNETIGLFRVQVGLRDKHRNVIHTRFSGDLSALPNKWTEFKQLIQGYPKGMRSIVVKFSGMSIGYKTGFHGAKCTAVRLQFMAPGEAELQVNEFACQKADRHRLRELSL